MVRSSLRRLVTAVVRPAVEARLREASPPAPSAAVKQELAEATAGMAALAVEVGRLSAEVARLQAELERVRPFTAQTTVHEAWARHPGVAQVFAAFHLRACPDCAVGARESLREAAAGYGLSLPDVLDRLNRLPGVPS